MLNSYATRKTSEYLTTRAREKHFERLRLEGLRKQAARTEARKAATRAARLAAKTGGYRQAAADVMGDHIGCRCQSLTLAQRAAVRSSAWDYCRSLKMPAVRMSAAEGGRWVAAQLRIAELYQATLRCVLHGWGIAESLAQWGKDAGPAPSAAELQARVQAYAAKGLA